MMNEKIRVSLILFLLMTLNMGLVRSQNSDRTFGRISAEELEMTSYPKDREAEAVVLFDLGYSWFSRFENRFDVIFERTTRIKVLSDAGIKYAEVEIPFYQEGSIFERVYDIEAVAYNMENGRLVTTQLNLANVYTERINDWWNVRKFAVPNVKSGTVIEYRYKVSSQYVKNLRDWSFQWRIPVVYSEYEVKLIPFYGYNFILQGSDRFDSYLTHKESHTQQFGAVTYHNLIHKYVMKDLPAFREETYITSINDYIIKIYFQYQRLSRQMGTG